MHPYHHSLFCKFIVYFNENQDYFECHEVLEDYWKSISGYTKEHPLTAFILLSTGLYHWRRGNLNGAYRTLIKAEKKMLDFPKYDVRFVEEIDYNLLLNNTNEAIECVKRGESFSPFKIHLRSAILHSIVRETISTISLLPNESDAVIHKHMLRDRSDILAEREKKKGRPL